MHHGVALAPSLIRVAPSPSLAVMSYQPPVVPDLRNLVCSSLKQACMQDGEAAVHTLLTLRTACGHGVSAKLISENAAATATATATGALVGLAIKATTRLVRAALPQPLQLAIASKVRYVPCQRAGTMTMTPRCTDTHGNVQYVLRWILRWGDGCLA
jgi:hypothetical protein